jgi:glycosyltransferase involved in cell wall biosynthesis
MRLLLVFPFSPYPPDNGGRIGFWNPVKYLSRRQEVHIAFLAEEGDRAHWEILEKHCASVQALFRTPPSGLILKARSLLGYPPGTARKYWDPRFEPVLRNAIREHDIELVEFHHLHTAAYRGAAGTLPAVLREHNVEHVLWERHARHASLPVRLGARWLAPRIRRYEAAMAEKFDRCVVVSRADGLHLRQAAPRARIEVIPSGVDTEFFYPEAEVPEGSGAVKMVYVGAFSWAPRQVNLRIVLEEIMPRIRARLPQAELCIVGGGIPPHLEKLAARTAGVTLTGAVADVRPYVRHASLVLNYVESGGGIALKVLEALALRKAVLSNPRGCEGIEVEHGEHVFLAEGPEAYAEAAVRLLGDAALRGHLAQKGFEKIEEQYGWDSIAVQYQRFYEDLLSEHRGVRPASGTELERLEELSGRATD